MKGILFMIKGQGKDCIYGLQENCITVIGLMEKGQEKEGTYGHLEI
ncbi:hypothetical protein A2U01_0083416, partial [Trifolium medium]|nr:hypothetical protein [Trifolium medium]